MGKGENQSPEVLGYGQLGGFWNRSLVCRWTWRDLAGDIISEWMHFVLKGAGPCFFSAQNSGEWVTDVVWVNEKSGFGEARNPRMCLSQMWVSVPDVYACQCDAP